MSSENFFWEMFRILCDLKVLDFMRKIARFFSDVYSLKGKLEVFSKEPLRMDAMVERMDLKLPATLKPTFLDWAETKRDLLQWWKYLKGKKIYLEKSNFRFRLD